MLKIWGRRSSFNLQKVMWLVGEMGLPREHIPAGGSFRGLDDPAFLAMNPHGRVPVIDDDGIVVWESQTILRYLAARYGHGEFWSDNAAERSQVERWMDWSQTTLQPDFLNGVFWGFYRTPSRNGTCLRSRRGSGNIAENPLLPSRCDITPRSYRAAPCSITKSASFVVTKRWNGLSRTSARHPKLFPNLPLPG